MTFASNEQTHKIDNKLNMLRTIQVVFFFFFILFYFFFLFFFFFFFFVFFYVMGRGLGWLKGYNGVLWFVSQITNGLIPFFVIIANGKDQILNRDKVYVQEVL